MMSAKGIFRGEPEANKHQFKGEETGEMDKEVYKINQGTRSIRTAVRLFGTTQEFDRSKETGRTKLRLR